jgi:hypothetical protein
MNIILPRRNFIVVLNLGMLLMLNVFTEAAPLVLQSQMESNSIHFSWSTNFPCYAVETTTNFTSGPWIMSPAIPSISNESFTLNLSCSNETALYFRLKERPLGPPAPMVIASNDYVPIYTDVEYAVFDSSSCDPGTGCALVHPLDGTITNSFDASRSVDNAQCSTEDVPLEYEWKLRYPPSIQGGEYYTSSLVLGRNTPFLTMPPNSLPALTGADIQWRVILTITKRTPDGVFTRDALFRFEYDSSELRIQDVPP